MLRKYGIGLLAFIIAVGSAAFTAPKKSHLSGTHVFEFNPTLTYTVANVTNSSNWQYVGEISQKPLCQGMNKACRVAVTDAYVDDPSNPAALSGVSISAALSSGGTAAVTGITDPTDNGFSNQP
jgi:hypothetical protein